MWAGRLSCLWSRCFTGSNTVEMIVTFLPGVSHRAVVLDGGKDHLATKVPGFLKWARQTEVAEPVPVAWLAWSGPNKPPDKLKLHQGTQGKAADVGMGHPMSSSIGLG